tara:strand:- start:414 stop:749 length:336 start_codon:yes stop_codon:yes gene_type:complete
MIDISSIKQMMLQKEDKRNKAPLALIFKHTKNYYLTFKYLLNYQGELKNPFENKNKDIRIKGPTPNTNKTIFAVLGVVFFSSFNSVILGVNFFLDFLLGIFEIESEINNSN